MNQMISIGTIGRQLKPTTSPETRAVNTEQTEPNNFAKDHHYLIVAKRGKYPDYRSVGALVLTT